MTTPTVYVICDTNCKYEGMTKEQIYTAIAQAVESGEIGDINTGFITTIKTITGTPLKFFVGTQAEYNELTEDEKQNLFAIISDDTTGEGILTAIETLQTDLADLANRVTEDEKAIEKAIEENATAIKENADNLADHAKHEFKRVGAYTITNGAGTLSTGRQNQLVDNDVYLVTLFRTSGGTTITYSAIAMYHNLTDDNYNYINIINVGGYKITISGDFIECDDLTLNGDLWFYKIGEI